MNIFGMIMKDRIKLSCSLEVIIIFFIPKENSKKERQEKEKKMMTSHLTR